MNILGISAFFHDSASCIIKNGKIISASQEERYSRIKYDKSFPIESIKFNLKYSKLNIDDIDAIVFYENPLLKLDRILDIASNNLLDSFKILFNNLDEWLDYKLNIEKTIKTYLSQNGFNYKKEIFFCEHHLSHAASSFYPSPFKNAALLVMDAVGEYATSSIHIGETNKIFPLVEENFPNSLGMLYSAFTYFLGFKVNSGEYKMMGLSPFGESNYTKTIKENLININDDGSIKLNMDYFSFHKREGMINEKFEQLFEKKTRNKNDEITPFHMDVASSIQKITEEIILKKVRYTKKITNSKNLCLSGGVALNCVSNGKLFKQKLFNELWIQPAAGDAGGALGCALNHYYNFLNNKRNHQETSKMQNHSYLGDEFDENDIKEVLVNYNIKFLHLSETEIIKKLSSLIKEGNVIGCFKGRMEFGPRALGARSILANPKIADMQKILNLKIKFREGFRPFAAMLLEEDYKFLFEENYLNEYMLLVNSLKKEHRILQQKNKKLSDVNNKRSLFSSITHIDYSTRVQIVNSENKFFYDLLKEYKLLTGNGMLINTSFNVRGEPIVRSPYDALKCFANTEIDYLMMENFLIKKEDQNLEFLKSEYKFEED